MKVWIYKNGFCEPSLDIGSVKQFKLAEDADAWIDQFIAMCDHNKFNNWEIYVTNDSVEFERMDTYVNIDVHYDLLESVTLAADITTIDIRERAEVVNEGYKKKLLAIARAKANAKENATQAIKDLGGVEKVKELMNE